MIPDRDNSPTTPRPSSSLRRGLTLAELVVSMGIATIVIGGMMSALVIASRATGSTSDDLTHTLEARGYADQILAELNHAVAFTEQSPSSLAFLVPDREGDGSAEEIRYSWSGTPGEALTREYNGGPPVIFSEAIQGFELTYLPRLFPTAPTEEFGAELFAYDGSFGGSFKDCDIDHDSWCAQYFKPDLPTNTVSWKVNLVQLILRQEDIGRLLEIQIRTPGPRLTPTEQVLQEVTILTDYLPEYYATRQFEFSDPADLGPVTGACLVITQVSGTKGARTRYIENGVSMPHNAHWTVTSNAGSSWSRPTSNHDMLFAAYGTVVTEGPPQWP